MRLISSPMTTAYAIEAGFKRNKLLLFSGNVPTSLDQFPFDVTDINEALLNCEGIMDLKSTAKDDFRGTDLNVYQANPSGIVRAYKNGRPYSSDVKLGATLINAKVVKNVFGDQYTTPTIRETLDRSMLSSEHRIGLYVDTREMKNVGKRRGIELDLGAVYSINGFNTTSYTTYTAGNKGYNYAFMEYFDEDSQTWLPVTTPDYPNECNINLRNLSTLNGESTSVKLGNYGAASNDVYHVTFTNPVVARRFRYYVEGKDNALGNLANIWCFTFHSDADYSDVANSTDTITHGMLIPYDINDIDETTRILDFKIVKIGEKGSESPEDTVILKSVNLGNVVTPGDPLLTFVASSISSGGLDGRMSNGIIDSGSSAEYARVLYTGYVGFNLDKASTVNIAVLSNATIFFLNQTSGAVIEMVFTPGSLHKVALTAGSYKMTPKYNMYFTEIKAEVHDGTPFVFGPPPPQIDKCLLKVGSL